MGSVAGPRGGVGAGGIILDAAVVVAALFMGDPAMRCSVDEAWTMGGVSAGLISTMGMP